MPLTEQNGLFFEGDPPPRRSLRTAWLLALFLGFTGPAVAYLQPAKGPAIAILSRVKAGAGATGVALPPGNYTLTVSTTGTIWHLTAEEYRLPG